MSSHRNAVQNTSNCMHRVMEGEVLGLERLMQSFYPTAMVSAVLWPTLMADEKKCESELQFTAQVKVSILLRRFV